VDIVVYGKPGCELCKAAQAKLDLMGLPYASVDLFTPVEGWRESGVVGALSWHMIWETLPVLRVDFEYLTYPKAMRLLKKRRDDVLA